MYWCVLIRKPQFFLHQIGCNADMWHPMGGRRHRLWSLVAQCTHRVARPGPFVSPHGHLWHGHIDASIIGNCRKGGPSSCSHHQVRNSETKKGMYSPLNTPPICKETMGWCRLCPSW